MRRFVILLLLCCTAAVANAAPPPAQKFVVYFQEWSAALEDNAKAVISQAVDYAKQHPNDRADVIGFASTVGGRKANTLLADLRAQVVTDELVAEGVPEAKVHQRGRGPVPFALTPLESRRVEISFVTR